MKEAHKDKHTQSVRKDGPGASGQREETQELKHSSLKCVDNCINTG